MSTRTEEATPDSAPRSYVLPIGLGLIAVQLIWRSLLVANGYFRQDDFHYLIRAFESPLSWDYLMWPNAGHLMPGEFAISWLVAWPGEYSWTLAAGVTLTLLACAGAALLRVLRTLFGDRPGILVPLAIYLYTPMMIPSLSWWAAAIALLPLQIAICMALHAHVRHVRGGRWRDAAIAMGWIVFGLLFFIKAAFIPVLLFLVTAWFLGGWLRHWRTWLLYAAPVVAYGGVYVMQMSGSSVRPSLPDAGVALEFGALLITNAFLPTAFGGPWIWRPISHDYAIADPPAAAVWICLAAFAAIVILSVYLHRRAWAAWVILLAYLIGADVVPLLLGRLTPGGAILGLELRYVADAAAVLAICLGLAFMRPATPNNLPNQSLISRVPTWLGRSLGVAAGLVLLGGSVWSAYGFADRPMGAPNKNFTEKAATSLAAVPAGATVIDRPVPGGMMNSTYLGSYTDTSRVFGTIDGVSWARKPYGQPIDKPMILDDRGRLRRADIQGPATPQSQDCTPTPVEVKLDAPLQNGSWTLKIAYLNSTPALLHVEFGGGRGTAGTGTGLGQTFTEISGEGDTVRISTNTGEACIGQVKAGLFAPSP